MELVVLGSSAATPAPGDACSGYLVRQGGTQLLLDCGSGVLSRLVAETSPEALTAIVISHFHPDHYLDLVAMRYALRYGAPGGEAPLLLVPPGGAAFLRRLGAALRGKEDFFSGSFCLAEYDASTSARVGGFELAFCRTTHDEPTWATAVTGRGRLVYTADTRPSRDLERFAQDADLLLCECTYPADAGDIPADNHLTSGDAGRLGRAAGVRQLLLTHFWPTFDRDRFRIEAEHAFGRPVTLAAPGLRLTIPPSTARSAVTTPATEALQRA